MSGMPERIGFNCCKNRLLIGLQKWRTLELDNLVGTASNAGAGSGIGDHGRYELLGQIVSSRKTPRIIDMKLVLYHVRNSHQMQCFLLFQLTAADFARQDMYLMVSRF